MSPETLVAIAGGVIYAAACAGLGWLVAPLIDAAPRPRPVGRHRSGS